VGILIKKNYLENEFTILNSISSDDGNILCLEVTISNQKILLVTVYGPNKDNDINVFESLKRIIRPFTCPIILGGDWNATLDISDVENNLDLVNMQNIPSVRRSTKIHEICEEFNLIEPFRTKYPNKREYTFVPSGNNEINRSRLDFFLISTVLYNQDTVSTVPHSLTSTLFDHKPVTLQLKRKKIIRRDIIKDTILKNADLDAHVKSAVFECYLQHWSPPPVPGVDNNAAIIERNLLSIGRINVLLDEIKNLEHQMALSGFNEYQDLEINGKRGEIALIFEDMPNLEFFENLNLDYEPEIFFQTLVSCIKNNVLSHQATVFKLKHEKKKHLTGIIENLKKNFERNKAEILNVERQLSMQVESELRDELLHFKKFESKFRKNYALFHEFGKNMQ